MNRKTEKYFSVYSEEIIVHLTYFPKRNYGNVLCIPVYDENHEFLSAITPAAKQHNDKLNSKILLILVINQPDTIEHCHNNINMAHYLSSLTVLWEHEEKIQLLEHENYDILAIHRHQVGKRIAQKQGVGLARKIACDAAAFLQHQGCIRSTMIFCSDADVIFPNNYFMQKIPSQHSAIVFNFQHKTSSNSAIDHATQIYQASLQHYVDGLKKAGSPYAYHSIGSCMAFSTDDYIKVRGFPKRAAGEDFYLLNKLNKIAPVKPLSQPTLMIQSRRSQRVPFGTGPAVERIIHNPEDAAIFYHPQCFVLLKQWLEHLCKISAADTWRPSNTQLIIDMEKSIDAQHAITNIFNNHKTIIARHRHIHEWFDAFKTLKAIHFFRHNGLASKTYQEIQVH